MSDRGEEVYELRLAPCGWSGNGEIVSTTRKYFFHMRIWELHRPVGVWISHVLSMTTQSGPTVML